MFGPYCKHHAYLLFTFLPFFFPENRLVDLSDGLQGDEAAELGSNDRVRDGVQEERKHAHLCSNRRREDQRCSSDRLVAHPPVFDHLSKRAGPRQQGNVQGEFCMPC